MRSIRIAICALVALVSLAGLASEAVAQPKKIEIGGQFGWQFGAMMDATTKEEQEDSSGNAISVDSLGEAIGLPPAAAFGLSLTYHITRTMHLELSFLQQPTRLNFDDRAADTTSILTDARATYWLVGLIYNWSETKRQPYIGFQIGITQWITKAPYEDEMGFVLAPLLGYKSWMSDYFGFKIQTSVLITNTPAGDKFRNTETGWVYEHPKNTWATQINISVAILLGR